MKTAVWLPVVDFVQFHVTEDAGAAATTATTIIAGTVGAVTATTAVAVLD